MRPYRHREVKQPAESHTATGLQPLCKSCFPLGPPSPLQAPLRATNQFQIQVPRRHWALDGNCQPCLSEPRRGPTGSVRCHLFPEALPSPRSPALTPPATAEGCLPTPPLPPLLGTSHKKLGVEGGGRGRKGWWERAPEKGSKANVWRSGGGDRTSSCSSSWGQRGQEVGDGPSHGSEAQPPLPCPSPGRSPSGGPTGGSGSALARLRDHQGP